MPYTVPCPECAHDNAMDQENFLHAGFGDVGFLYNEAGTLMLTWSSFDPAYSAIVGDNHPWTLDREQQQLLEAALKPSPAGDRWLFTNPPRCFKCAAAIGEPITKTIYYFWYPGSIYAGRARDLLLSEHLR